MCARVRMCSHGTCRYLGVRLPGSPLQEARGQWWDAAHGDFQEKHAISSFAVKPQANYVVKKVNLGRAGIRWYVVRSKQQWGLPTPLSRSGSVNYFVMSSRALIASAVYRQKQRGPGGGCWVSITPAYPALPCVVGADGAGHL